MERIIVVNKIAEKLSEMDRSYSWLARKVGVTPSFIGLLAKNKCNPNLLTALRICHELNARVEDIFVA
jgi:DNA-binding XRE family transcriptional regulator